MCGTAASCESAINTDMTADACNAGSNQCECGTGVAACSITSETCQSGTCMCGAGGSCDASINTNSVADACDSANGVCTCGGAAECTGGQTCQTSACAA